MVIATRTSNRRSSRLAATAAGLNRSGGSVRAVWAGVAAGVLGGLMLATAFTGGPSSKAVLPAVLLGVAAIPLAAPSPRQLPVLLPVWLVTSGVFCGLTLLTARTTSALWPVVAR
jgi:hypothetical protein